MKFDFKLRKNSKKPVEEPEKKESKKVEVIQRNSSSPDEQARRFDEVLDDPPLEDHGQVELWSAKDKAGNNFVAMPNENGEIKAQYQDGQDVKVTLYDPLFAIDLKTLFEGQLAEVPMNVIPNLMDEYGQLVANEEKDWKPDKAKRDWTQWYWIIVGLSFIPMVIIGVMVITGFF